MIATALRLLAVGCACMAGVFVATDGVGIGAGLLVVACVLAVLEV